MVCLPPNLTGIILVRLRYRGLPPYNHLLFFDLKSINLLQMPFRFREQVN